MVFDSFRLLFLFSRRRENFLTMEEDLTPNIELRFLSYRLKILSVKKTSIHKLMYPLAKIAFTNKTACSFFSFDETNDDYSIVLDLSGYESKMTFTLVLQSFLVYLFSNQILFFVV